MSIVLEAIECDSPHSLQWPDKAQRVIPARWWARSADNARWIEIARIPWWRIDAFVRAIRLAKYWPLRLVWKPTQE